MSPAESRFLLLVLLAMASVPLRAGLHGCWLVIGPIGVVAEAQPIADPGFGDPTRLTADPAASLPPINYGPNRALPTGAGRVSPQAPTTAVRPPGWPGGNPQPHPGAAGGARVASLSSGSTTGKQSPADPPYDPAEILARVGSERIQACEVLPMINRAINAAVEGNEEFAKLAPEVREREIHKAQKQYLQAALNDIAGTKLLVAELRTQADAKAVNENKQKIRDFFNNEYLKQLQADYKASSIPDLENKLRALGGSIESQRTLFIEQNLANGWLNQQVRDGEQEPTHEEMLAYYRDNIKDWTTPARARWEQITARFANFNTPAEARAALARWGNDVVVRRVPFAEVAKAHSQDYAADEGGLHDWASQGSLRSEAIDTALFQLPPGVMSRIVEDDDGCHIIRVVQREAARTAPFSEAQAEIRERLNNGGRNQRKKEYIEMLREQTPVWTVFDGDPLDASSSGDAPMRR